MNTERASLSADLRDARVRARNVLREYEPTVEGEPSEVHAVAHDVLALADEVESLIVKQRELHRRAQKAESDLANKPTLAVLGETLEALKQAKSDRHRLRNDYAYKVRESQRLRDRVKQLEREAAEQFETAQRFRAALDRISNPSDEMQKVYAEQRGEPKQALLPFQIARQALDE